MGGIARHAQTTSVLRVREERLEDTCSRGTSLAMFIEQLSGTLPASCRERTETSPSSSRTSADSRHLRVGWRPADLVSQLNRYFALMVDAVTANGGIVDKYIDDAVMAVFGAPVKHEDDEMRSVLTAFAMLDAAETFNREQKKAGRPEFPTSVGISYGVVTVGNIGCGKRMDYTVIGDRVNLASRAQGMCKVYHQPLIFTGSVHRKVKDQLVWRMIDNVAVKGKRDAERIYTGASG